MQYDLIVIGSGPGGYVAAIRAAQLGLKVACIDKQRELGGTCLNVGCIPSKALLHATEFYWKIQHEAESLGLEPSTCSYSLVQMMNRKAKIIKTFNEGIAALFKKNKVTPILGAARILSPHSVQVAGETIEGKNILIATGSEPTPLAFLPFDEKRIVSSTGALSLAKVPPRLLIIGAGVIGVELGSVYSRLGSQVTFLEFMDRICPAFDTALSKELEKVLRGQGMTFHLSTKVTGADIHSNEIILRTEKETYSADVVLVAIGRKPYTAGLGLDTLGLSLTPPGMIPINNRFQTSIPSIYAIGDVVSGPMLAHKASEEGVAVAEIIAAQNPTIHYIAIPNVVYTYPEVASVGLTEEEAKKLGLSVKTGQFPLKANSRAQCTGEEAGFVKMVADSATDKLVGVHIIGAHASELIAEAGVALQNGLTVLQLAHTPHAHPTLSEALKEAALAVHSRPIHR